MCIRDSGLSGIGVRVRFGRRDRVDGHRNLPDSVPQAVDRFRTYRGRTHLPHARISDCSVGRLHHQLAVMRADRVRPISAKRLVVDGPVHRGLLCRVLRQGIPA